MDAKPTERSYGKNVVLSEGWYSNPSVLTGKSLINQKGGCIASKTQQSDSLCLAVNPPPFNKGGKCDSAFRGIVRFWKGWCERGIVRKRRLLWGDVDAGTVK